METAGQVLVVTWDLSRVGEGHFGRIVGGTGGRCVGICLDRLVMRLESMYPSPRTGSGWVWLSGKQGVLIFPRRVDVRKSTFDAG